MCGFCKSGGRIANVDIECGFLGGIQIALDFKSDDCGDFLDLVTYNTTSLSAEYPDDYIEKRQRVNISYCPICGRKLVK